MQYSPCNYSGYWGGCARHPDATGGQVTSGCVLKDPPHQAAHQTISILYANQPNPWKLPQALCLDRVLSERSTRIHQPRFDNATAPGHPAFYAAHNFYTTVRFRAIDTL